VLNNFAAQDFQKHLKRGMLHLNVYLVKFHTTLH
jgi:hypothetical protein